jgi:hypothetical protein
MPLNLVCSIPSYSAPTLPLAVSQLKDDFLTLISNELSVAQSTVGHRFSSVYNPAANKLNGVKSETIKGAQRALDGAQRALNEIDGHEESGGEENKKVLGEGVPPMEGAQAAGEF